MTYSEQLIQQKDIFYFFNEVYLFGSVLSNGKSSNDVDLLLVYKLYSKKIQYEKENIILYLEKKFNKPVDVTILSKAELKQTDFLNKLENKFKKIK